VPGRIAQPMIAHSPRQPGPSPRVCALFGSGAPAYRIFPASDEAWQRMSDARP
jgi:hypothetical protein